MSLETDVREAVANIKTRRDQIAADALTLHAISHGPASGSTSLVTTDSGSVRTAARAIAELVDGQTTAASIARTAAEAARDAAATSATSAQNSAQAAATSAASASTSASAANAALALARIDSYAQIAAGNWASQTALLTRGYYQAGDGGGALYRKVSANPGHPGAVQSADGAWWELVNRTDINVRQLGAKVDNVTDDGAAINNAILTLPATGGRVTIDGVCRSTVTITLGNGSSTVASTRNGVRLVGVGGTNSAGIRYDGAAGGTAVVTVAGPITGFEVSNLVLDGNGKTLYAINLMSAQQGKTDCLTMQGFTSYGYLCNCYSSVGYATPTGANCEHISVRNLLVVMPTVANAIGFVFAGPADGTSSTCFVDLAVVRVYMTGSNAQSAIYFSIADTVSFRNLLVFGTVTNANFQGVIFDYSSNPTFPSACVLDTVDVGWKIPVARQWMVIGTPGANAINNKINNLSELNGGRYPSRLPNTVCDLPKQLPSSVFSTGATAAVSATAIATPSTATIYKVTYHLEVTQVGTAGTVYMRIFWKKADGSGGTYTESLPATALGIAAKSPIFECTTSGGPYIMYDVAFVGVTGPLKYNLYITVDRMN